MIDLDRGASDEFKVFRWILLELGRGVHEQLVLRKEVVRDEGAGTRRAAEGLAGCAEEDDAVGFGVRQDGNRVFQEVVCC